MHAWRNGLVAALLASLASTASAQTPVLRWDHGDPTHVGATWDVDVDGMISPCTALRQVETFWECQPPAVGQIMRLRGTSAAGVGPWAVATLPTPGESSDGTVVSDTVSFIRDANANLWSLAAVPGVILRNGGHSGGSGFKLKYVSGVIYAEGLDHNWWRSCGGAECWSLFGSTEPGTTTSPPPSSSLFDGGFETGDLSAWADDSEGDGTMTKTVVTSPVVEGNFAARFTLDLPTTTFGIARNEIRAGDWTTSPGFGAINQEYTYTFSHFVPASWPTTALPIEVAQFHGAPDFDLGENWKSPSLAFYVRNGTWEIENYWDASPVTTNPGTFQHATVGTSTLERGAWNTWVVQVRWSWGDPAQAPGYLKIWKNGQPVVDRTGPNTFNDQYPRIFKWGIYTRSEWAGGAPFPVASYELFLDGFTAELGLTEPPPPPPPPPTDPCVTDPLVVSRVAWPSANTGRRSLTFDVGSKTWDTFNLTWRDDGHHVLTVLDTRGCSQTVQR